LSEGYKSPRQRSTRRAARGNGASSPLGRELRAQGRKTMGRLLDAGMRVFGERGVQAARVDDIVRAARTSHGTFYLYFPNKEALLGALAVECGEELDQLSTTLGPITPDDQGYAELRAFLDRFFTTYRHYGPVIRAWMEGQVEDREVSKLGVKERFAYYLVSRRLDFDADATLDTVTTIVHRGFFAAA
jgi:AcrR family transcriptional regulator